MINTNELNELLTALKCSAEIGKGIEDCKTCKYMIKEKVAGLPMPHDIEENGEKYWIVCDYERMILDAIDVIKELADV